MAKRILVVKEGDWRRNSGARGDNDDWAENVHAWLSEDPSSPEVQVIDRLADAEIHPPVTAVVFLSRGMLHQAQRLKLEHAWLKVVVLTGEPPDDQDEEVEILNKGTVTPDIVRASVI